MSRSGLFFTFEGIEGTGKTTQINRFYQWLVDRGIPVVMTREPGGTDFGKTIREMILDPKTSFASQYTEVMLFVADRLEHVASVIEPALRKGSIVLCDRFIDSTIAYQVGGRQLSRDRIESLNSIISVCPNHTVLLDVAPIEGLSRAKRRAALDRFEKEELDFHHRVREMYLVVAREVQDRMTLVSTDGVSEDLVFQNVVSVLGPIVAEYYR